MKKPLCSGGKCVAGFQSVLPENWKQMMEEAVQSGIAQGMKIALKASESSLEEICSEPSNLENLNQDVTGILKGEDDMPKRFKERVEMGKDDQGKPIYKWAYGRNKKELQISVSRLIQEACLLNDENKDQEDVLTVRDFIETVYIPTFFPSLSKSSVANYTQYINLNIVPFMGNMPMNRVTVATIQQFYDWMACAAERGRKKNLNAKTIERISGLTARIFRIAMEMKIIQDTPFKKTLLRINAEEAGHHTAFSDAEISRIKKAIPKLENKDERLYMALLAFTGMRPEEARGLRWQDLCLQQQYGRIKIAVTYPDNNHPCIGKPKTERSSRTVLLPRVVVEILQPYEKAAGFILGGDEPWCYSRAHRVSKSAFKHLEIVGFSDYDFRSTFGTQLKEMGKTSAEVADLMGHADTRMVETVYARTRHEGVMKHLDFIEKLN